MAWESKLLHERLRRARERKRLGLREAARRSGLTHTSIRIYEKGDVSPRVDDLLVLAEVYGTTAYSLVKGLEG